MSFKWCYGPNSGAWHLKKYKNTKVSVGDPSINITNTFMCRCTYTSSTHSAAAFLIVRTVTIMGTQLSTESNAHETPRTHSWLYYYTNTTGKPGHWMNHFRRDWEKSDQCISIPVTYRSYFTNKSFHAVCAARSLPSVCINVCVCLWKKCSPCI